MVNLWHTLLSQLKIRMCQRCLLPNALWSGAWASLLLDWEQGEVERREVFSCQRMALPFPSSTHHLPGWGAAHREGNCSVLTHLLEETQLDLAPHQEDLQFPDRAWHHHSCLRHGEHSLLWAWKSGTVSSWTPVRLRGLWIHATSMGDN